MECGELNPGSGVLNSERVLPSELKCVNTEASHLVGTSFVSKQYFLDQNSRCLSGAEFCPRANCINHIVLNNSTEVRP